MGKNLSDTLGKIYSIQKDNMYISIIFEMNKFTTTIGKVFKKI